MEFNRLLNLDSDAEVRTKAKKHILREYVRITKRQIGRVLQRKRFVIDLKDISLTSLTLTSVNYFEDQDLWKSMLTII
jgi:hypothetical protein